MSPKAKIPHRLFAAILLAFAGAVPSRAAEVPPAEPVDTPFSKYPDLRMMEDVFDVELPATTPKRGVELSISPRFVDTVKQDYLRIPLRFKYGLTNKWEFAVRLQPYVNNPSQGDRKNGVENIRFSTKYHLDRPLFGQVESALGIGVTLPLEDEKDGITDGYNHFTPFVTVARTYDLSGGRQWQWFTSAEYDILGGNPDRGDKPEKDDELSLLPGLMYGPPGFWRYVFYVEWDTTRIAGGDRDDVFLVPGVLYDPPRGRYRWLPGDWEFELAGKLGLADASDDHGVILKIKIDFASVMKSVGYDPGESWF